MRLLISVFGFTKKTAEKLVFALKGKVDTWVVAGSAKWHDAPKSSEESEAVSGLLNLGYSEEESREIVAKAKAKLGENAATAAILQEALKSMGSRLS